MSPEFERSFTDQVDIWQLVKDAVVAELNARDVVVSPLSRVLELDILGQIMPDVKQRVWDTGHDFDSLDLIAALEDDEEGPLNLLGTGPDDKPDDNNGGNKIPRRPILPLISGPTALTEPMSIPDILEGREDLFPKQTPGHSPTLVPSHR